MRATPAAGSAAVKRSQLSTEGERRHDGGQRREQAEGILGEGGPAEASAAQDRPAPGGRRAPFAEREEEPGEAELYRGHEERLGTHVAGEDDEERARAQGGPRETPPAGFSSRAPSRAVAAAAKDRSEHRGKTGGPLRHAPYVEVEGDQPVEKGRLVEIPDTVQAKIEKIARHPRLARDLRVLPLA